MSVRTSLLYVAAYLLVTGFALAIAPEATLRLMQSDIDYGSVMPRWVAMFSIALGTLILQVVKHRLVVLYRLGFYMPAAMLVGFGALYWQTRDPLFLTILGVVGTGVLVTGISLLRTRR